MLCEMYLKLFKKGMPYKWNLQEKKTKVNVKYEEKIIKQYNECYM